MSLGKKTKTEHSGGKNGGGYWGTREEAKNVSKKIRRKNDEQEIKDQSEESTSKKEK